MIGIDNEELTRYLWHISPFFRGSGAQQMGYQAAKLLHRLLDKEEMPLRADFGPTSSRH